MKYVGHVRVRIIATGVCSNVFLEGHRKEIPLAVVDVGSEVHREFRVVVEGRVVYPRPAVNPRFKPVNQGFILHI